MINPSLIRKEEKKVRANLKKRQRSGLDDSLNDFIKFDKKWIELKK